MLITLQFHSRWSSLGILSFSDCIRLLLSVYQALARACLSHLSWSLREGVSALLPVADEIGGGGSSALYDLEIWGGKGG